VIVADHSNLDYDAVLKAFPLVVDTRNALKGRVSEKIFRL
jgi:UDP-N-acetyl-D-mannosaminuronate dehydrogenase